MDIVESSKKVDTNERARDESSENAGDDKLTKRARKLTPEMDIVDSSEKDGADGLSIQSNVHNESIQSPKSNGDQQFTKIAMKDIWKGLHDNIHVPGIHYPSLLADYCAAPPFTCLHDNIHAPGIRYPSYLADCCAAPPFMRPSRSALLRHLHPWNISEDFPLPTRSSCLDIAMPMPCGRCTTLFF